MVCLEGRWYFPNGEVEELLDILQQDDSLSHCEDKKGKVIN
jgi:hypothetical protein